MTDSTTNRTEPDILTRARDDLRLLKTGGYEATAELVEGLIGEVERLRGERVEIDAQGVALNERFREVVHARELERAQLAVAYDVIRRLRTTLDAFDRYASTPGGPDYSGSPFESEVRSVLDAVAGPDDTEENRDGE